MTLPLRKLTVLLLACALALGATACGGSSDAKNAGDVPASAIALVGDKEVPKSEFTSLMDRAQTGYEQQKRKFPKVGSPEYQDLKSRAVTFLVQRYEYREEAQNLGITVTDAQVQKRLDEVKQQSFGGSEEKFKAELAKLGLTEAEASEEIRDRLIQEAIYKKVTSKITVTDAQIKEYYDQNSAQFTQPRQIQHILVKKKSLADSIEQKLRNGADFAKLAKKYSTDKGSAKQGGRMTITKGQTVPEFDKAAFALKSGEISEPVKSQFGFHIIKALSDVKQTPLDQVKASIKQQLLQQKQNAAMETWLKQVKLKFADEIVYAAGYTPAATTQQTTTQ